MFEQRTARVVDGNDHTFEGYLDDGKIILIYYSYDERFPSITINIVDEWKQSYETYPHIPGEVYDRDVSDLGALTMSEVKRIVEEDTGIDLIEDEELREAMFGKYDHDLFEDDILNLGLGGALSKLTSRRDVQRYINLIAYEKKFFSMRWKNKKD